MHEKDIYKNSLVCGILYYLAGCLSIYFYDAFQLFFLSLSIIFLMQWKW